jgi:hypothetical protein
MELCTTDEINQSKAALVSRINGYLAGCRLDWGPPRSWSLATPFPPTLAPHLLGQVNFEKNCLANGTRSHPHGFPPFTVIEASVSKKEGSSDCRCPSPAKLRRQPCPLWHSQTKLCAWALGRLSFCRARTCLRSSTARSYQNKNAGLVGPADSCSSPCGETTRF